MKLYRRGSHTLFDIKYHLVWCTKYRKPVLTGKTGKRARDLTREICSTLNIKIIKGHVSKEHVHIMISAPPNVSVSTIAQRIKGKIARKLLQEDPKLNKKFWGKHFWARGYFVVTSGTITDEIIMEYIKNQDEDEEKRGDNFTTLDATT